MYQFFAIIKGGLLVSLFKNDFEKQSNKGKIIFAFLKCTILIISLIMTGCGICKNRLCINTCDQVACQSIHYEEKLKKTEKELKVQKQLIKTEIEKNQKYIKEIAKDQHMIDSLDYKTEVQKSALDDLIKIRTKQKKTIKQLEEKITYLESENNDLKNYSKKELYLVQLHDSFSKIALKIYGKISLWPLLWWVNKETNPIPDLLYTGQKISIEKNWNKETYKKAEQYHNEYLKQK